MAVGRINGYKGAGIERREAAEGILCFPVCVSVSIGVGSIKSPFLHRFLSAPQSYGLTSALPSASHPGSG